MTTTWPAAGNWYRMVVCVPAGFGQFWESAYWAGTLGPDPAPFSAAPPPLALSDSAAVPPVCFVK